MNDNLEYQLGGETANGYDAIFRSLRTYDNQTGDLLTNEFALLSGTFSNCVNKLQNNQLLNIVYYSDDGDTRQVYRVEKYTTDSTFSHIKIYVEVGPFEYIYWSADQIYTESTLIKYLSGTLVDFDNDYIDVIGEGAFYNYTGLKTVKTAATTIEAEAFYGCSGLDYIYLTSNSVCELENVNALQSTSIAAGLNAIYVPDNLVSSYKSATNWSTYADVIYSINDYPVTDFSTISDSWSDIITSVNNGTYSTRYNIGDTKLLSINGNNVYMQLVAFNKDTLASNGNTVATTWIAKGFAETRKMNATAVTTNGWAETEMRTWLRETILPTIDSTVRSAIKEVTKTYYDYTSSSTLSIADTIWIPSLYEMGFTTSPVESSGVKYDDIFSSSASRIKYNTVNKTAAAWWLRSADDTMYFRNITSNGSKGGGSANGKYGVVVGFCI
jgi:hypothetical protein